MSKDTARPIQTEGTTTPAQQEREAVVRWIRSEATRHFKSERADPMFALDAVAEQIERGDHNPNNIGNEHG